MMSMDIRKIDVNYRRTAAVVLFVLAVALVCAMVYLWQEGRSEMEYSVDEHFGLVPSLSLCDRAEHPVRFAKYQLQFFDASYKQVEKVPRFAVKLIREEMQRGWPNTTRTCLHFISTEEELTLDLGFKVSFVEGVNVSAPRQFADIVTDLILNAHVPGSARMTYAGHLAMLPSYEGHEPEGGAPWQPSMRSVRVQKTETTTRDGKVFVKYLSQDTQIYHLHRPSLPDVPVPTAKPVEGPLRVVQWNVMIPQPRVVLKNKEVPLKDQFLKVIVRVGGSLTIVALCFQAIFPRKYANSSTAATMEIRTLRGSVVEEKFPVVDPEREHFRKCRLTPSTTSGAVPDQLELSSVS